MIQLPTVVQIEVIQNINCIKRYQCILLMLEIVKIQTEIHQSQFQKYQ